MILFITVFILLLILLIILYSCLYIIVLYLYIIIIISFIIFYYLFLIWLIINVFILLILLSCFLKQVKHPKYSASYDEHNCIIWKKEALFKREKCLGNLFANSDL